MIVQASRCPAVNEVRHLRCDREAGHPGAHVQDDSNALQAWGPALVGQLQLPTD